MITGEIKNKLDNLWDAMWSNQMTNPWIDIQQITYLIFIKMLDDNQIKIERKINSLVAAGVEVNLEDYDLIFKDGFYIDEEDKINCSYADLRWSVFSTWGDNGKKFDNLKNNVFPFIKNLHGDKVTSFAKYMKKAEFAVSNPYILGKMIEALSDPNLGFNKTDMMGDCYEYLLSKMATSGDNGQFRTPRHIIDMIVELAKPTLSDIIIDPAMGTAGFLSESAKYIKEHYSKELTNKTNNQHFHNTMFTGFDTDTDMLRIGCMNMTLHGVENPTIKYNNSLGEEYDEKEKYSLVLANPPFAGSLDSSTVEKTIYEMAGKTKKTELLFIALFLRILKVGGRCISIIPVGVLNNNNDKGYERIRKELVENQKLNAVIFMPSGIFEPYSPIQTGIFIFDKTNTGGTNKVWIYDMQNDGFTLDKKREPIEKNDIPDIIYRWNHLDEETSRTKKDKSFFISIDEIREQNYFFNLFKFRDKENSNVEVFDKNELLQVIISLDEEYSKLIKKISEEI